MEVVDYRNPYRYFINNDKMFQIDNVVYKAIGDFLVSTAIDNITKLKTINAENISLFENDPKVHLMNYRKTDLPNKLKDVAYNCGTNPGDGSVTNGNERTVTHLDIYMQDIIWAGTALYSHYLVRPYHKVLFIWYWCDRDLYADIDVAEDYYINAWSRIIGSVTINFNSVVEQKLEQDVGYSWVSSPGYCTHTYHYGAYYFKADSNTTDEITISCHSELF